jgi:hypothetical protein
MIAEQIASLRLEKGERLFDVEDARRYAKFEDLARDRSCRDGH